MLVWRHVWQFVWRQRIYLRSSIYSTIAWFSQNCTGRTLRERYRRAFCTPFTWFLWVNSIAVYRLARPYLSTVIRRVKFCASTHLGTLQTPRSVSYPENLTISIISSQSLDIMCLQEVEKEQFSYAGSVAFANVDHARSGTVVAVNKSVEMRVLASTLRGIVS